MAESSETRVEEKNSPARWEFRICDFAATDAPEQIHKAHYDKCDERDAEE